MRGRREEAVKAYKHGIEIDPGEHNLHLYLGRALCDLGRNVEALEATGRAIELDGDSDDGH